MALRCSRPCGLVEETAGGSFSPPPLALLVLARFEASSLAVSCCLEARLRVEVPTRRVNRISLLM